MSDSTSTPPPAPPVNISPSPATAQPATANVTPAGPSLSVRDAARLLSAQRRPPEARADTAQNPAGIAQSPAEARADTPQDPAGTAQNPAEGRRDALSDAMAEVTGQGRPPPTADEGGSPYELDGRPYTQAELRAALGQANDYTKKTQEIARQQKELAGYAQQLQALDAQHKAFQQALPLLQPEINKLVQTFQMAPRPDPSLIDANPQEYHRQWAQFEHSRAEMERIQGLMQHQQAAQERNLATTVARSNEMLSEKYGFWRDPAKRAEVQGQIAEWATTKGGYTRDELRNLADHRHLEALMKASMFDRMMDGAKTTAPMQIRPPNGAPPPPVGPAAVRAAEGRFDERPNWRNAAALLSARRSGAR